MASDWFEDDTDLDDDSVDDENDVVDAIPDNKLTKQQKLDIRRRLEERAETKRLKNLIDDFYDFDIDDDE